MSKYMYYYDLSINSIAQLVSLGYVFLLTHVNSSVYCANELVIFFICGFDIFH